VGSVPEDTIVGGLTAADVAVARETEEASAAGAPDATVIHRAASPVPAAGEPRRRRRRRGRGVLRALALLLVVAAVLGGLFALSRQVYFIGTNDGGLVTVYRGIPYELPLGIDLYEEDYASAMPARAIPARRRERVLDHEWRSRDDAVELVRALERGELDAGAGR
jgi:protein phosphatase